MSRKVISAFIAFSLVLMMVIVPQVSVYAATVSNDTTNKVVTMTGSNYKMIFNYNAKVKITSFVVNGRETLDSAGMYSVVKNSGTWVTTETLGTSPSVSVNGSVVTATFSTSVANETWTFTCSDANISLKLSRTYNGAYTVNMQGTPMIHWTPSLFENIRWKDSAGNFPIAGKANNLGRADKKWIVAGDNLNTNIAVGQEQVSFSMLSNDANATALKVDTTTNHDTLDRGRVTQLRRTSSGALQTAIETSASNMTYATGSAPWGYTTGANGALDMYGMGRSDGGDIFSNVSVSNGQNDTVTMVFSPDNYSNYYDIGTINGIDGKELSHVINDLARFVVMDKRMGGFFGCAQTKASILTSELDWVPQVFSIFPGDNSKAINSLKSSLDLIRQYCVGANGSVNGSTPGAELMTWGYDHPDQWSGYVLGAVRAYYLSGDTSWLQTMKTSMENVISYEVATFCDQNHYYFVKNHQLDFQFAENCYWEQSRGTYCSYCTAQLYDSMVKFAQLERNVLNDTTKAAQYESIAATIKANYSRNVSDGGFWSTDTNSVLMGTGNADVRYIPAQAQAVKTDIISADKKKAIAQGVEAEVAYYNGKFHPFNWTTIRPAYVQGLAQYTPGGEDGGWYPCSDGDFYAAFPYLGDRSKMQDYIKNYLDISATGNGFYGNGAYARDGVTDVGYERWFTSQVMPVYGLYTYAYGFQPQYNELVIAPFISPSMVGSTVKYTWRGQTISVKYNSLYSYSIIASSLPTNIRVRFINQDANTSYTVNVDGSNNSITSDSNGNVEAVMSSTGTHSYTLSNPKAENSALAAYTGIPIGYTYCANENGSYALSGTCDVVYGANGKFNYLYGKTGTITFNNTTFGGDPISGTAKKGYYKTATSPAIDKTGWTVSASSQVSPSDVVGNAKDGNYATRWSTGQPQANGQWFTIDMGSTKYITRILLKSSNGDYPRGYQIYVSNDGTNWGSAIASGAGISDNLDITLDASYSCQIARYIKIVQTGSASNWWGINEVNVYGTPGGIDSSSYFKIVNRTSGKVLDNGGTSNRGAQIQQWEDNAANNTNQQWKIVDLGNGYYKLVCRTSNMVMDDPNGSTSNGTIIQQYDDNAVNNINQQWTVQDLRNGYYKIICRTSGKALDDPSGSTSNGTIIQQYDDNASSNNNQQWQIIKVQ